jgi:broad specificity phosphatase PhoE
MRIGLVRHFPVKQPIISGWKTAAEIHAWRQHYDASPAVIGQCDIGSCNWAECLSSDLERTVSTAKAIYSGEFQRTPLLREPELAQFSTGSLRLPMWVWRWILRLSWMTGHSSQRAGRDEFHQRVKQVADLLEGKAHDVLIVSHAGMMAYLSAELRRRGYTGPKLRVPRHTVLYVYEKR